MSIQKTVEPYPLPPKRRTQKQRNRRVGIEFEFANVRIEDAASIVQSIFGGKVDKQTNYDYRVTSSRFGEFKIELDSRYMQRLGKNPDKDNWDKLGEELLAYAARQVIPLEIVSPPIPITKLHSCDELVEKLRDGGAEGTSRSLISAFGLQLNPELPSLKTSTIIDYLRAFVVLYDWLVDANNIDNTRRVAAFVQPYPREYVQLLLDGWYQPDQDELIDDYLQYNADRNRALDMLPLFSHLDPERVKAKVGENEKINARPTFHYRMPNCEIDDPQWSLRNIWEVWLEMEKLAYDPERLSKMCRAYSKFLQQPIESRVSDWAKPAAEYL